MKMPGEVLLHGSIMLAGAACILLRLPTTEEQFQAVAVALAVVVALVGVLILCRFRWSPELLAVVLFFVGGWGAYRWLREGYTASRLGMLAAAVAGLSWSYPDLRRAVRGVEPQQGHQPEQESPPG